MVWSDSIDTIIPTCHDFEERLIKLLWRSRPGFSGSHAPSASSHPASVNGEYFLSGGHTPTFFRVSMWNLAICGLSGSYARHNLRAGPLGLISPVAQTWVSFHFQSI